MLNCSVATRVFERSAPHVAAERGNREVVTLSPCHLVTLSSAVVALAIGPAHAHALYVECKLKGDTVVVEAFFSDNTPARDARVTVRNSGGGELAAGRTDDAGRWRFPAPAAGKYEVTCDLGDGHRKVAIVTIPTAAALKPITPPPEEIVVSGGPTREELTRFPWLRLLLGVAAIGGLAVLLWLATRRRGPTHEST
jgi:hypothetical protein